MVSIILNTKLFIIQFYSEVLAFVKSDLTGHPQVAIFLRGIFSKYLPEKLRAGRGGEGGCVIKSAIKKHVSQNIFIHFT